jgi:hypothetical protein
MQLCRLPLPSFARLDSRGRLSPNVLLTVMCFQPAPCDLKFSFPHDINRFAVRDVFLLKDASGEGVLVVGIEYGDGLLQNDRAVVEFFVHEVNRAA